MSPHLVRARQLLSLNRFDQAADEFRRHLLEEPGDAAAHSQLAICLCALGQFAPAAEHARTAIGLGPDESFAHYALAWVLKRRRQDKEAMASINEAIRLDSGDPDYFAFRAELLAGQSKWSDMLEDADRGLAIDPDHVDCMNLRMQALMRLGRRAEAAATIGENLARDPDNATTQANAGWRYLETGEPRQALDHFREALRIDPDHAWARQGIIEALKAKNIVYRLFLRYLFWMTTFPPNVRWGIVIGGFFGQQFAASLSKQYPAAAPALDVLIYGYMAFALFTWLADPLFNLLLFTSRYGRHVLTADQRHGAMVTGGVLLAAVALLAWALFQGDPRLFFAAITTFLLLIPASAVHHCPAGWPRYTMIGATVALGLLIPYVYVESVTVEGERWITKAGAGAQQLLIFGLIGSQFLANYLAGVRVRR